MYCVRISKEARRLRSGLAAVHTNLLGNAKFAELATGAFGSAADYLLNQVLFGHHPGGSSSRRAAPASARRPLPFAGAAEEPRACTSHAQGFRLLLARIRFRLEPVRTRALQAAHGGGYRGVTRLAAKAQRRTDATIDAALARPLLPHDRP